MDATPDTAPARAPATPLEGLEGIALGDARRTIDQVVALARELLDMEIAYFSSFSGGDQVMLGVEGASSFGFGPGTTVPLDDSYCRRMVEGLIPNAIPATQEEPGVRDLPPTRTTGIGAYIGVPLRLSSGRIFGTFCCASHRSRPALGEAEVGLMRVLARLIADQIEREGLEREVAELRAQLARGGAATRPPPAPGATIELWFAGAPNAAAAARRALEALSGQVDPARLYDVNLLVTELVANSVQHAGIGPASAVGLQVELLGGRLRVEVTDSGPGFEPRPRVREDDRIGGWGLVLVEELSDRWGVAPGERARVWFEIDDAAGAGSL